MRALLSTSLLVLVSYLSCEAMKLPSLREDTKDDEVSEYSGNTFCVDWEILCEDVDASTKGLEELKDGLRKLEELEDANEEDEDFLNDSISWMEPILGKCNDETVEKKCKKEADELEEGEEKVEEEEALVEGEEKVEDGEE